MALGRGPPARTDPVVDGAAQLLLAPEVTLGGLDRDVTEQKLDLIQLAAGSTAEPGRRTAEVVRRELLDPCP
ncbi:MAG TPA: hypothetical protein VG206_14635 [Terriglobia bacterium]|nr:hypothetical protein [Terriglobia bacterium]